MAIVDVSATKDRSTVTESSEKIDKLIQGVTVRRAVTHVDERGDLSEIYNAAWNIDTDPVTYVYTVTVRPGRVKGWVYHTKQADRIYTISGAIKYVIWDSRPDSPTHGMINEIFLSDRNRGILRIPPFTVHAVQNIGQVDAIFVNLPTLPYNHANPDKYRVSPESVPYNFDKGIGW
jgi:dTDP-4-dehydrorhamnose 3,5-epimerase